jgi:hypothetical protein
MMREGKRRKRKGREKGIKEEREERKNGEREKEGRVKRQETM